MAEEKDYFAALGVEPMTGAEVQEPAEPAQQGQDTGENVSEPAEPTEQRAPEEASELPQEGQEDDAREIRDAQADADEIEEAPASPEEQTTELRRKFAAQRRRQETQQAIDQARQEERERAKQREQEFFRRAGLKNPYEENKTLSSFDDFDNWYNDSKAKKLEKDLKAGTLTAQTLQEAVSQMPLLQEAKQLISQAKQREQEAAQEKFRLQADRELAEIRKMEPEVKNLGDILAMETGPAFATYVREKGLTYLEAFRLANADRLASRRAAAEKQRTLNAVNSKNHLEPIGGSERTLVDVPKEARDAYRMLNPGMTDLEIQKEYTKWTT